MGVPVIRKFVSWMMVLLCPLSLTAADTGSAVLHSEGGVWVNGFEISGSTVVFPGDLLETKPGFVANVDAEGSSVVIQPESVVKFQGTFLSLEHGSVSVGTSTSMSVHVSCIKVEPVSSERTQYDVADVSGTVQVAAHKTRCEHHGRRHPPKNKCARDLTYFLCRARGTAGNSRRIRCLRRRASARKCRATV